MRLYKQIILGSAITAAVLSFNSCSDFLDTEPISDRIKGEEGIAVIVDAADAEEKMKAIYSEFGGEFWQMDQFMIGDAQTDISYAGADNVQMFAMDEYRMLSTNSVVDRDWNYLNTLIYKTNILLNNVDDVPGLSNTRKEQMKAEASIMRAYANFWAVQLWGDFPIVTRAITNINDENFEEVYTQIYPARKPASEVYDFIISDLQGALTSAPAASEKYKANKGAAIALLAKVYAAKPNPDWAKVSEYCDQVTSLGYTLQSNYSFLFDGTHEGNSESIFEVDGNGSNIWAWGSSMFYGTDWKKFNTPSNDLMNDFTATGDNVRKNISVTLRSVPWSDANWPSNNFPLAYKMRKTDGQQNIYLIRYADILLLKAEAAARNNDLTTAVTFANRVRSRVLPTQLLSFTSQQDALDKILHERKLELAFEGHRWFDLKRFGKSIEILSQQKDKNGVVFSYAANLNQNRLLWPIPQSQMDKNVNLTQNPGF